MPTASAPDTEKTRTRRTPPGDLRRRLLTASVLVPLFVAAIVLGGAAFLLAIIVLAGAAAVEFLHLSRNKPFRPRFVPGVALAVAWPTTIYWAPSIPEFAVALLTLGVVGIAAAEMLDETGEEAIASVAVTVFGATYVGILFGHLVLVREVAREVAGAPYWLGAALLAIPIALTWINDTAAYMVGRSWGRHRLIEAVSPGKSIEGALGALVVTTAVAVPAIVYVDRWIGLFDAVDGVWIGALVSIAGPVGDLIVSSFKRDAGVKDASHLIPGHGGILDRFDSMLVTVPVFYYYLHGIVL